MYAATLFFAVAALIPVLFLIHATGRFARHCRDGRQVSIHFKPKLYYTKRVSALVLSCIALCTTLNGYPPAGSMYEMTLRTVCFSLFAIAWLVSFRLVGFEYVRRLEASWFGHRLYWIGSFIADVGYSVYQALHLEAEGNPWLQVAAHIVFGLICLFLSFCAIWRPNDFSLTSWTDSPSSQTLDPQLPLLTMAPQSPVLRVSVDNFKKKVRDGVSLLLYAVTVSENGNERQLWKTYQDFEALYQIIIGKFRVEFPKLDIPTLPEFTPTDAIETRVTALNSFLTGLNFPAFHCEEYLTFLNITGEHYTVLLSEHYKVIGRPEGLQVLTFSHSDSVIMQETSSVMRFINREFAYGFFEVTIAEWRQCGDGHVEYDIQWKLSAGIVPGVMGRDGVIAHRFNEFYLLHKALKEDLAPAKLPHFPSKTYISRLTGIDKDAIERRRSGLERYLRATLNDPAYLAPRLLDFIDCKRTNYRDIFLSYCPFPCDIHLLLPLHWECEISESDEQHIVYMANLERGTKRWTIKRHFSEFEELNRNLTGRALSPLLREFVGSKGDGKTGDLPVFHRKGLQLVSVKELETRKSALESYLQALLQYPLLLEAYVFRQFLEIH